jgi:hypothetical protein
MRPQIRFVAGPEAPRAPRQAPDGHAPGAAEDQQDAELARRHLSGQFHEGAVPDLEHDHESVVHGVAGQVTITAVRHQLQPPAAFHIPAT